jgi:hypothetical protein
MKKKIRKLHNVFKGSFISERQGDWLQYTANFYKSFSQRITSKQVDWWNSRVLNVMKTWDIFLIISLALTAAWCIYSLIVFSDLIFV